MMKVFFLAACAIAMAATARAAVVKTTTAQVLADTDYQVPAACGRSQREKRVGRERESRE